MNEVWKPGKTDEERGIYTEIREIDLSYVIAVTNVFQGFVDQVNENPRLAHETRYEDVWSHIKEPPFGEIELNSLALIWGGKTRIARNFISKFNKELGIYSKTSEEEVSEVSIDRYSVYRIKIK